MQRYLVPVFLLCASAWLAPRLDAAIVLSNGSPVIEHFNSAPAATEWATGSVGTTASEINDDFSFDRGISLLSPTSTATLATPTATLATLATPASDNFASTNQNALARYNSADGAIQTQPTGVAATYFMATLQNPGPAPLTALGVAFDYAVGIARLNTESDDNTPGGFRLYYSTTAATGSWTAIGDFGAAAPNVVGSQPNAPQAFTLTGLNVAPSSNFYVLWGDDNGVGGAGSSGGENYKLVDNVSFTMNPVPEPSTFALAAFGALGLLTLARRIR